MRQFSSGPSFCPSAGNEQLNVAAVNAMRMNPCKSQEQNWDSVFPQANRSLPSCPGRVSSPHQKLILTAQMPLCSPIFQDFTFFILIQANTLRSLSFGRIMRHLLRVFSPHS